MSESIKSIESVNDDNDDISLLLLHIAFVIIFYSLIIYYKLRSKIYFESFIYLTCSFIHIHIIIPDYQNLILQIVSIFKITEIFEIFDYIYDIHDEYNDLLFFFFVTIFYFSSIILYTPSNKFIYLFIILLHFQIIPYYYYYHQIKSIIINSEIFKYIIINIFKDYCYEKDDFLSLFMRILYVSIFISITWSFFNLNNKRNNNRKYMQRIVNNEFGLYTDCYQPNTYYMYWCQHCNSKRLQQNFDKWTSGNKHIDKFIQESQTGRNYDEVLEWIPYNRLRNIQYLTKGGFSTIYKAIWLDGNIYYWMDKKQKWKRGRNKLKREDYKNGRKDNIKNPLKEGESKGKYIVLKGLNNSSNIHEDFLNEVSFIKVKIFIFIFKI